MSLLHTILAIIVAIIWGINFIFIKLGLDEFSPLLFCSLRFFFSSIPFVFFIKPPKVPFRMVIGYGMIMFALQFSLLFIGLQLGMTSGMASLITQAQVFFSIWFAAIFLGEHPHLWQILGAVISFFGISLVGWHLDPSITFLGLICVLASAATWGCGNLIAKKMLKVNMIALVVWGSFVACFPLLLLTIIFEGPIHISTLYKNLSPAGITSLMYIVYISTWIGYGLWNWLMSQYPVGKIVPFSLLIPIVGMFSSVMILGESMQPWKIISGIFVIAGLCINLVGQKIIYYFSNSPLRSE